MHLKCAGNVKMRRVLERCESEHYFYWSLRCAFKHVWKKNCKQLCDRNSKFVRKSKEWIFKLIDGIFRRTVIIMLKPKIVCISGNAMQGRSVKPLSLCVVAYLLSKAGEVLKDCVYIAMMTCIDNVCTVSQKNFKQLYYLMCILHFVCVHVWY